MDSQTGVLPEALAKRQRVVRLETLDKTIIVEKWSLSKLLTIVGFLEGALKRIPKDDLASIAAGNKGSLAKTAGIIGPELPQFLALSVKESDKHLITDDIPGEDGLELLEAVLDLNLTGSLIKKGKALWARLPKAPKKELPTAGSEESGKAK